MYTFVYTREAADLGKSSTWPEGMCIFVDFHVPPRSEQMGIVLYQRVKRHASETTVHKTAPKIDKRSTFSGGSLGRARGPGGIPASGLSRVTSFRSGSKKAGTPLADTGAVKS